MVKRAGASRMVWATHLSRSLSFLTVALDLLPYRKEQEILQLRNILDLQKTCTIFPISC